MMRCRQQFRWTQIHTKGRNETNIKSRSHGKLKQNQKQTPETTASEATKLIN